MSHETAGIGHNLGPSFAEIKAAELALPTYQAQVVPHMKERYKDVFERVDQLVATAATVPEVCTDVETAEKISDLKRQLSAAKALADNARKTEKKPWTTISDSIHNLFEKAKDTIDDTVKRLAKIHNDWMELEAAKRRAAAEEEARKKKEEAEAALRAAAEAERRRKEEEALAAKARAEAEAAEQRKLEELRQAEEAKRRAEQAKRDEEAAKVREAEAKARAEAARKKMEEDEAAAAIRRAELAKAEAEQIAAAKERAAAREAKEREEKQAREARERADAEREEQRAKEAAAKDATASARDAGRDEKAAMTDAIRADRKAAKADDVAGADLADLSRHRGEHSVSSLQTIWDFRDMDRAALDIEALRPYFTTDHLEQAVRAAIRAGHRKIKGVTIYEDIKGQTR